MGAANTFREIGAPAGICVFVADVTKGVIAVLIAYLMGMPQAVVLLAGVGVVAGHNWPLFLGFDGGRGEASTIGVLLIVMPREMSILLAFATACLAITRDVILTSVILFVPLPLVSWLLGAPVILIAYGIALPCLVALTHYITTRDVPVSD